MRGQRRTTIIVVGGALAIASVGYGLGTQAGDGNAVADSATDQDGTAQEHRGGGPPPLDFDRGAPPGFSELATKLGVDTSALMRAMRDFHDQHESDRRHDFAAMLAKALGISTDKVQTAFERMHPGGERRFGDRDDHVADRERHFASALANKLGAKTDDVKAALDKLKGQGPFRFDQFATKLADELGVDVSDVRAALRELRPRVPGPGHRPDFPLRRLARELGVSRADLRSAFRKLRQEAENGLEQERQELARFLADRFHVDVSKVEDALAAVAPPLRSPHPPGPRDHPIPL